MEATVCWTLFLLYSVGVVVVSFVTTGREKDAAEFWSGGKDVPWWKLSISLTSGWLMLGWIGFGMGQVYMFGATGLWILPIPWFLLCAFLFILVPLYRRIPFYSIPDAFEKRFGPGTRVLIGVFSLGVFLSWTGAELIMVKTLVGQSMGVPDRFQWLLLLIFVFPIMIYTYRGGFRAIVNTDLIQFALMAVFMIVLLVFAIGHTSGALGDKGILEVIRSSSPPWLGKGAPVFGLFNMGVVFPVALLLGYLPGWFIEQDLWLRIQAAGSVGAARKAALGGGVLIVIFILVIPSIVAFLALAAFPPENGAEAAAVGGPGSWAVGIIPAFIAEMPVALAYFMFLGIVACQMSTVDTFANVAAMALSNDVLNAKGVSGRKVGRMVSVFVLFLAFLYAVAADKLGDVYYISSGVLSASIAVPLFSYGWKRVRPTAVYLSSATGALCAIGFYLLEYKVWDLTAPRALSFLGNSMGYNYLGACVLTSALALVLTTLLMPRKS